MEDAVETYLEYNSLVMEVVPLDVSQDFLVPKNDRTSTAQS